jgi:enoyl-CoA hydratase
VAAVNGPALAGGFDLAVLCDLVGGAVARDLCLTGRRVDAQEALALRLVSAVVPPDELPAEAARVAAQIARAPRALLARTKAKIARRARIEFQTTLDL